MCSYVYGNPGKTVSSVDNTSILVNLTALSPKLSLSSMYKSPIHECFSAYDSSVEQ